MIPGLGRQRWIRLVIGLCMAAILFAAHTVHGQDTTVRLEVPSQELKVGGGLFSIAVVAAHVTNLGAFEFELTYDQHILKFQDIQEGPFLGSSGRRVDCLPPRSTEGSAFFTCVTLGSTPEGPDGSGVLATLTFQAVGAGTSPLHFARLILTDPPANRLPSQIEDASVTVVEGQNGGFRWVVWGPVIAGVATVLAASAAQWFRRRARHP